MASKSKKGTWPQALVTFFSPLLAILVVRFFLAEPFVIPSGSMIPTLLVHDHILVSKLSYGLKIPGLDPFLTIWKKPQRFEIVVFRYPKEPDVFYIKRILGLPGDIIEVQEGEVRVNGEKFPLEFFSEQRLKTEFKSQFPVDPSLQEDRFEFQYFLENRHWVRYLDLKQTNFDPVKVPDGQYFMMGDNRNQSSDSRYWGFVPEQNLIGRPLFIWLSCTDTLPSSPFICAPQSIRWPRLFKILTDQI